MYKQTYLYQPTLTDKKLIILCTRKSREITAVIQKENC